ncbi:MAG TPA: hypothetical protein DCE56_33180 [Cyanobacteria bacterium UBA8553]|nr:hypothetical protein [Cyanobacteria bacterium UBA8553]HAJ64814.1 hypothetical protein [Cyanobacteria bacterium UBA8543]
MKVTIRDSQILKTIEPDKLAEHLQKTGWHQDRPLNENSVIWVKDYASEPAEVLLPLNPELIDYAARISDALKTLEVVEQRSQLEILSDLFTCTSNITIQGIVTNLQEGATAGRVTLMGVVLDKLRRIQLELTEPVYELAVKAYQARIPVICQGDLKKQDRSFVLQNPHHFTLDLDAWVG